MSQPPSLRRCFLQRQYCMAIVFAILAIAGIPSCVWAQDSSSTDAPADVHCGPRAIIFLLEYLGLPHEELGSLITEMDDIDNESGATLSQLASAMKRRGLTVNAYELTVDSMIESDSPVVLHLKPLLSSNSLGHFSVLLPTSTPTHSDVWVGVEGVQSGSPAELRRLMSGAILVVSQKPSQVSVRPLSPLRMSLADNYHWWLLVLPGATLILIAVLMSRPRGVPVPGELT